MGLVKLADLKPGMVLGKPVFDRRGNLVLREGVSLSEKHIQLLTTWGVANADVQGQNDVSLDEIAASLASDPRVQEELARIESRFSGVHDEVLLLVRDTVKRRFLAKATQK